MALASSMCALQLIAAVELNRFAVAVPVSRLLS
jgi:hypothetical protein